LFETTSSIKKMPQVALAFKELKARATWRRSFGL